MTQMCMKIGQKSCYCDAAHRPLETPLKMLQVHERKSDDLMSSAKWEKFKKLLNYYTD